jgi:hypothetical protein
LGELLPEMDINVGVEVDAVEPSVEFIEGGHVESRVELNVETDLEMKLFNNITVERKRSDALERRGQSCR